MKNTNRNKKNKSQTPVRAVPLSGPKRPDSQAAPLLEHSHEEAKREADRAATSRLAFKILLAGLQALYEEIRPVDPADALAAMLAGECLVRHAALSFRGYGATDEMLKKVKRQAQAYAVREIFMTIDGRWAEIDHIRRSMPWDRG